MRRAVVLKMVPAFAARPRLLERFVREPLEGFLWHAGELLSLSLTLMRMSTPMLFLEGCTLGITSASLCDCCPHSELEFERHCRLEYTGTTPFTPTL